MTELVNVEGTELDVREYNGQMVVTFDDIDLVHKRPSGTARKAFNRNKKRFINGVDYIVLEKENSNVHPVDIRNIDIPNRGITVFTESGYLMLVKPFKDDLSWDVQRALVNGYFSSKNQQPTTTIEEKPVLPIETDWFCINRGKINYICRCYDITSREYMHHLLEVLGRTYNFDEAKRIYITMTGNWKCRNSEVITYFPQLSDLASKILQKDLADCAKEETP
jgi:hypothetical protein|nr:MAG TPA: hypothetical protein [Caudoviricetes sp.]